jgi:hypothetical protein
MLYNVGTPLSDIGIVIHQKNDRNVIAQVKTRLKKILKAIKNKL